MQKTKYLQILQSTNVNNSSQDLKPQLYILPLTFKKWYVFLHSDVRNRVRFPVRSAYCCSCFPPRWTQAHRTEAHKKQHSMLTSKVTFVGCRMHILSLGMIKNGITRCVCCCCPKWTAFTCYSCTLGKFWTIDSTSNLRLVCFPLYFQTALY